MPLRNNQQPEIERRAFDFAYEERSGDSQGPILRGYAAVFNQETVLISKDAMWDGSPEIREVIEPGAFTKTLREKGSRDVMAFWNHDSGFVLGRTGNDTLTLEENSKGLKTEIHPPDNQTIRDLVIGPIQRGDVNKMSFGFQTTRQKVVEGENVITFHVKEVRLFEVSPVAIPAYPGTSISARSMDHITREIEKYKASAPGVATHPDPADDPSTPPNGHLDDVYRLRFKLAQRGIFLRKAS